MGLCGVMADGCRVVVFRRALGIGCVEGLTPVNEFLYTV